MYRITVVTKVNAFHAGKTLKEQAQVLSRTHIYILFHGAAMALYMFLPKNAAIIEVCYPRLKVLTASGWYPPAHKQQVVTATCEALCTSCVCWTTCVTQKLTCDLLSDQAWPGTLQVQHYYANSPTFPSNLYGRTTAKYDMGYQHAVLVSPRPQDIVLQRDKIVVRRSSQVLVFDVFQPGCTFA